MRICFVSLHYNSLLPDDPGELLDQLHLRRELPAELAELGHEVYSVQSFPNDARLNQQGVEHHFVGARSGGITKLLLRRLQSIDPDVVHVHGIKQRSNLIHLRSALRSRKRSPKIVVHFHGGEPTRRKWARPLERLALLPASRILMTTQDQCKRWQAELGLPTERFRLLPEGSSPFQDSDRAEARRRTGITGSPVFLAVSRLDEIKDPMTLIRGFEQIHEALPEARLYWYFANAPMLEEVESFLGERLDLQSSVKLVGKVEHASLEAVFNSADFFLQASLREYSSFSLLDAMACGVVPILSDIPSFRALAGETAEYFPVGDASCLASRVLEFDLSALEQRSREIRARFDRELSFASLASQLEKIYQELVSG